MINVIKTNYILKDQSCLNGGYRPIPGYPCVCLDGYKGLICEIKIQNLSPCLPNPCQNKGVI